MKQVWEIIKVKTVLEEIEWEGSDFTSRLVARTMIGIRSLRGSLHDGSFGLS